MKLFQSPRGESIVKANDFERELTLAEILFQSPRGESIVKEFLPRHFKWTN